MYSGRRWFTPAGSQLDQHDTDLKIACQNSLANKQGSAIICRHSCTCFRDLLVEELRYISHGNHRHESEYSSGKSKIYQIQHGGSPDESSAFVRKDHYRDRDFFPMRFFWTASTSCPMSYQRVFPSCLPRSGPKRPMLLIRSAMGGWNICPPFWLP